MKFLSFISCMFLILLSSCNEVNPKGEKEVLEFVEQWNKNHTLLKHNFLENAYMDVANYYGIERTRLQIQKDKLLLFQQFPDYTQRVLNNEINITKEAGKYLVVYTKRVNYNGIEADYTSYLTVMFKNGLLKIMREGVSENSLNLDAPIFPFSRENNPFIVKNRQLFGDFNGDDLSDYAAVVSPEVVSVAQSESNSTETLKCKGVCKSVITFSNKSIKDIIIYDAYKSQLENLKDLNSDGADEIGFWNIKPNSKSLHVFDANNNRLLCDPIFINTTIHKNLSLIDVIKKSGSNKITVTRSEQVNGIWGLKSEVISLD